MTMADATELVTLTGGLCVPLPSLQLLWNLEDRGFHISIDAEEYLVVAPRTQLTPADDQVIRRYRTELIMLVRFVEATVQ